MSESLDLLFKPVVSQAMLTDFVSECLHQVVDLQCEHLRCPIGLDEEVPRFSWKITSSSTNVNQGAYQIQVTDGVPSLSETYMLWDSGRRISNQSVLIEYAGPRLVPHTRYYWRVRIWDQTGMVSDWSALAYWETGFMGRPWNASWVTFPIGEPGAPERPCRFISHRFFLENIPDTARLYITAKGIFEPWLNGNRVAEDWLTPGWTDYTKRLEYLTYDITEQLRRGENVFGAIVADGWYCGYLSLRSTRNHYGTEPALLAMLRMVDADGNINIIGSGEEWYGSDGPLRSADLYMGEVYDSRKKNPLIDSPYDFSDWQKVDVIKPESSPKLEGKQMPPTRAVEVISAISMAESAGGGHVFDFGQNLVGVVRLKVSAPCGTRITLRYAEMLNEDGSVYTENLRSAKSTDVYICSGNGKETYQPRFTFHGFRYVELTGDVIPALDALTAVVIQTDLVPTGYFSCSHTLVNKLQQNIQWGQRGNFLEIPMDCPQRDERLGWTGDAQIFCRTATFNYDVSSFFRKWMTDVRDAQYEDGSYPDVAPDLLRVSNDMLNRIPPHPHSGNAAYAEAGVICPWIIYERYGDKRILEENYAAMCRWIDYQIATSTGYICPPTSYGDWLATDAVKPAWAPTPCELVGTAYFAYTADIMAKIALVLEKLDDARFFSQTRKNVVAAFQHNFVTASGRVVGDTQTGYLLALGFDLIPEELVDAAGSYLIQSLARRNNHLSTGFVGTPLLCPVLSRINRKDLAYQVLLNDGYPSWLFPVKNGATTIWERWNSWTPEDGFGEVNMNSFNHYAYGAIGEWLYGNVAGIESDPDAPGFKHVYLRPELGPGLTFAEARLESPYGLITSAWKISDGNWTWRVAIPPNTTATILLPEGILAGAVTLTNLGVPLTILAANDSRTFLLGSGEYLIESDNLDNLPL